MIGFLLTYWPLVLLAVALVAFAVGAWWEVRNAPLYAPTADDYVDAPDPLAELDRMTWGFPR